MLVGKRDFADVIKVIDLNIRRVSELSKWFSLITLALKRGELSPAGSKGGLQRDVV